MLLYVYNRILSHFVIRRDEYARRRLVANIACFGGGICYAPEMPHVWERHGSMPELPESGWLERRLGEWTMLELNVKIGFPRINWKLTGYGVT